MHPRRHFAKLTHVKLPEEVVNARPSQPGWIIERLGAETPGAGVEEDRVPWPNAEQTTVWGQGRPCTLQLV